MVMPVDRGVADTQVRMQMRVAGIPSGMPFTILIIWRSQSLRSFNLRTMALMLPASDGMTGALSDQLPQYFYTFATTKLESTPPKPNELSSAARTSASRP